MGQIAEYAIYTFIALSAMVISLWGMVRWAAANTYNEIIRRVQNMEQRQDDLEHDLSDIKVSMSKMMTRDEIQTLHDRQTDRIDILQDRLESKLDKGLSSVTSRLDALINRPRNQRDDD